METTAPAARVAGGGKQPEASSGRKEDARTASNLLTPAAPTAAAPTAAAPMAAAPTTAGTVTGGQREVAVAVVTTTATGASTTATTAAAAAEVAKEEDTVAGSNPVPIPDTNLLCLIYSPSPH